MVEPKDRPALVAHDVSFAYEGEQANERVVSDLSLSLQGGELVLLAGPNGSGKSTLLRLFGGLLAPDQGSVELFGEAAAGLSPRERARRVASVPQALVHLPDVRVGDFVQGGRYAHPRNPARDRAAVDRALEEADVEDLAFRSLREISGGQLSRVLVARALAQEAPLLLFDEPTASLDPGHQVSLLSLVRRLVDQGRTAVLVTHELALAPRYSDRIVLLSTGRLRASGTPREVLVREVMEPVYGPHLAFAAGPERGAREKGQAGPIPIVHPWPGTEGANPRSPGGAGGDETPSDG